VTLPLNVPQQLFLDQARSDYTIFRHLAGRAQCHRLHYLQMSTEKLAKVYAWRHGNPPGMSHHHFVNFLKAIESRPDFHEMFGYRQAASFGLLKPLIFDLAIRIERLAPAGNSGPNPEYPWPPSSPTTAPARYSFSEWTDWNETRAGFRLRSFIGNMLDHYDSYFP
jgi:hypothetical protein